MTEFPFFKTKSGHVVTMNELIKAAEIIWGEDPDFYMDWYEIRDKIGAVEMTAKQTYDIALNKGDKILAIKAYRAMKAEQGDRYYSLIKAKEHVEKVLAKRSFRGVLNYKLDPSSIVTVVKEKKGE